MKSFRLKLASLLTLGLLGIFIFILLSMIFIAQQEGEIPQGMNSLYVLIGGTVGILLILWLIAPVFLDIIHRWLYKTKFHDYEDIKDNNFAIFMKKVCDEHNIPFPKFGIIDDKNPTAFTYGSTHKNARIIVSQGLFEFLTEEEFQAVIAHEIGHIHNRDFIVMSVANALLQILFIIYEWAHRVSKGKNNEKNILTRVASLSYLFYWVGVLAVLNLSRIREYLADDFSARITKNPNLLSSALMKIGYGIVTIQQETHEKSKLLEGTRALGILDHKSTKNIQLLKTNTPNNNILATKAVLFDVFNPWAKFSEILSTHPLIGKRLRVLSLLSPSPIYDFEKIIIEVPINKNLLWKNFFKDIFMKSIMTIICIFIASWMLFYGYQIINPVDFSIYFGIGGVLFLGFLLVGMLQISYRFPTKQFFETDVVQCMSDVYASPYRGTPVSLQGQAIGKGSPGYIFSEDIMFQDETGIMYLNYQAGIPLIGNLFFALKKIKQVLGQRAKLQGWFLRSNTSHITLKNYQTETDYIRSHTKTWYVIGTICKSFIYTGICIAVLLLGHMFGTPL